MIGIEDALNSFSGSVIDRLMKAIWAAAMWLLRTAFALMDGIGGFRDGSPLVDGAGRPSPAAPFFAVWPTLIWIGGAVAVGLFLWQLTLTMIRGGAGFWRVASGPVAYGVATAMTLGVVAALVGASEGLTVVLLQRGLAADNFRTILDHPNLGFSDNPVLDSSIDATARALLLGMIALIGLLPAAVGFLLQMLFRQAVIIVLIATVPITAAGLLANTTATWFWRSLRWMLAAILMKPALALVLVVGVNMLSGPTGVGGLLAGAGVLLISLFCPLVLFRLLAFVEHGNRFTGSAGVAPAVAGGPSIGADAFSEQINTARFDAAAHGAPPASGGPGATGTGGARSGNATLAATARSVRDRAEPAANGAGVGQVKARRVADTAGPGVPRSRKAGGAPSAASLLPVGHRPLPPRTGPSSEPAARAGGSEPRAIGAAGSPARRTRGPVTGVAPANSPTRAVLRRSDDAGPEGEPR